MVFLVKWKIKQGKHSKSRQVAAFAINKKENKMQVFWTRRRVLKAWFEIPENASIQKLPKTHFLHKFYVNKDTPRLKHHLDAEDWMRHMKPHFLKFVNVVFMKPGETIEVAMFRQNDLTDYITQRALFNQVIKAETFFKKMKASYTHKGTSHGGMNGELRLCKDSIYSGPKVRKNFVFNLFDLDPGTSITIDKQGKVSKKAVPPHFQIKWPETKQQKVAIGAHIHPGAWVGDKGIMIPWEAVKDSPHFYFYRDTSADWENDKLFNEFTRTNENAIYLKKKRS